MKYKIFIYYEMLNYHAGKRGVIFVPNKNYEF